MNSIEQEKLPVMISVRGEQYFDDVDPNATELMTEGTLEQTEDGFLLSYQETELTGMEGTLTTFEIGPGRVILWRSGSVNSQMVFEEGGSTPPCMKRRTVNCPWIFRPAACSIT